MEDDLTKSLTKNNQDLLTDTIMSLYMYNPIFNLTPDTQHELLTYGPARFNIIIKQKIPGLSSIFEATKQLK